VARNTRRMLPLYALAGLGVVALGLAAPKLVPLFEELQRFPRVIKSDEAIFPQYIPTIFTWRISDYAASADFVSGALWHEWGLYVGWPALIALVAAIASAGETASGRSSGQASSCSPSSRLRARTPSRRGASC